MKKFQKRILACLVTLAMLVPVLSTAVCSVFAATTSGTIGNMDPALIENLIAPADEAMLNMENGGGIRFATNINTEKYAALKAFCKQRKITDISFGTLIAPVDYIQEAGEFSKEKLGALEHTTPYLDVKCSSESFYKGERFIKVGYDEQFVASLMNIKVNNLDRDFAAIGYIELVLMKGSFIIYSYDNADMTLVEKYATNIAELAAKELEKDGLSEEERAKLGDLAAEPQSLPISSDNVKDVIFTRNQVFFTYTKSTNTFYNRITYDGANGWRLQSNYEGYNNFKDISAGQSLAMYMGEGFHDVAVPLTVQQEDGKLVITAEGTEAKVVLSYDTFNLDFCGADGKALYNVNSISIDLTSSKIKLTGKMNATDAVYGGGETFDDANKRGQTLNLYISDAYNASGSYVAIPLFSTSSGGGMFVNRYEHVIVSFPKAGESGEWSITVDSDLFDGYFYATGKIADVLQGYTNLTGHASLPEEWAQGYLVCRYAPDFNNINDTMGGTEGVYWREDLPNPEKYTFTPHLPLTAEAAAKLKNGANIQDKDGKITYYTFSNGQFKDIKTGDSYTYAQLQNQPNKADYYYDDPIKVSLAENRDALCHKKSVTYGTNYYHYIIESNTEDFNYNGITGETYFLRVGSRGGPGGAGVIYVVESLMEAGMKPTGVVLEGVNWYNASDNLKPFVEYLNQHNIKTLVYTSLGHITGKNMGSGFKDEYYLRADLYLDEIDSSTGERKKLLDGTNQIPKSDATNNPDTTSGGSQIYLDITNPDAVKWYVDTVWKKMMELGVDGIKIDFCESVPNEGIYSEMKIGDVTHKNITLKYRWYDATVFEDKEPHHAYPSYFVSMFYKAMEEKAAKRDGDTGFVLLTRGGGIGAQRNPYLWAGDQERRFQSLSTQLAAVINSGISGIPFMTYDMGGYAYAGTAYHYYGGQLATIKDAQGEFYLADQQAAEEYESEIFVRALQFTTFGNLIQTHGYVRHVYQMTEEAQQISALYSALHEELADYLQKLSKIACNTGMPMVRHMVLEYQNDANVANIDDQFMYGDALLLAPILTCNTKKNEAGKTVLDYASVVTREVYLPAGEWIDLNTGETIVSEGQTITVSANLAKIPAYLNTASADAEELQAIFAGETWSAIKALANAQSTPAQ